MDVFEDVRRYYEETIDWQPDVKREWVEEYLESLKKRGVLEKKLADIWQDIQAFSFYQDRSEHHNLARLPFWEYSVCLEWMKGHIWHDSYNLTLDNAKRFFSNLLGFYRFLVQQKYIENCTELEKAFKRICGSKRLRLVKRIPYTGEEMWTALSVPNRAEETFQMRDYWLIILYRKFNKSWSKLVQEVRKIPSSEKKLALIQDLRQKLENIGYSDPLKLLYHDVSHDDYEDAKNWFYRRKI